MAAAATTCSAPFLSSSYLPPRAIALESASSSYPANCIIPGKGSEFLCHNSGRPGIHARARKRSVAKKHKQTAKRSLKEIWPADSITAEIQEYSNEKTGTDLIPDDLPGQDSMDHGSTSTMPEKTPVNSTYQHTVSLSSKETDSDEVSVENYTDISSSKGKGGDRQQTSGEGVTSSDIKSSETDTSTIEDKSSADVKGSSPIQSSEIDTSTFEDESSADVEGSSPTKSAEIDTATFEDERSADVEGPSCTQSAEIDTSTFEDERSAYGEGPSPTESVLLYGFSSGNEGPAELIDSSLCAPQGAILAESAAHDENERLQQLEAEKRNVDLRSLHEKSSLQGLKMFLYPESPQAGEDLEIFLDRSKTTLAEQPNIKVMGAFNDWRWKSFVIDLKQTDIPGDWWSCQLRVPNEAYKIDFVFFNGGNLYENNSNQDFGVLVVGGMQKDEFEDFLIEEERKEVERIAIQKALEEKRLLEERKLAERKAAEEVDRAEARKRVNDQREMTSRILQKAVKCVDGIWYFEPSEFQGGDVVKFFYNRANRPLAFSKDIWIHGGYNNWQDVVSIVGKLSFFSDQQGDWWTINVEVPRNAYVLNWVLADGPPEHALTYDNNSYQDFHALVPKGVPNDLYWEEMEEKVFAMLQEERRIKEEAATRKAEYTKEMKQKLKDKTKTILRKSQAHIFYTDPIDVQAGKSVTIFYNPSDTVLNGKPDVWLRASFNRWTHRAGCLPPVKLLPAGNSTTFLKATIRVPLDAYMMDFVFSERGDESGGLYDNNNCLDYHVPVVGGIAKEPPMKVTHICVEMAPIAKVGGLGDVVTSLSRAVQDLGHHAEVVLPKYDCLKYEHIHDLQEKSDFFWGGSRIKIWNGTVEGLTVHFLEPDNGMFWAGCIYGRRDDGQRFGFFCRAALEYLLRSGRHPDIIHCHDWSSAPVAWLFREHYKQSGLSNARIVFTIHNLEFGTALIGKAMAHTDKATTVSETYAKEVSRNPAIAPHLYKFHGIRNGIDLDIWDPYNDPYIPVPYTSEDVIEGKRASKGELQRRLGLAQADRPLVGIITRLTAQKGIHLIKHAIWKTLERGGQVVLLGSAPDPRIQNDFKNLANQLHNSRGESARLCLHYDEPLSHLIYAASDFILIPSMFEPCGLTQLIAMRYGAIPVVRKTGGLNDTVFDVDHDRDRGLFQGIEPNGFSFDGADASGVDYALNRALSSWYDARDWFHSLCKQVMEQDWSWNRPALDYMELYYGARK